MALLLPLLLLAAAGVAQDRPTAPAGPPELTVMTFNLRYAARDAHPWERRLPLVVELWRQARPDVVGTQEGLYGQLRDLERELPDYRWIGLGREGGSHGEFMAIFFRPDALEPLEYDHFWLSETPDRIGSQSWGSACPRMVTWVRFRHVASGRELVVVNTHLDHVSERARVESAALILERTAAFDGHVPFDAGVPHVLLGDFNAAAGESEPYRRLVERGGFRDAWVLADHRGPEVGTFHGYAGPREGGPRIDWILVRKRFRVREARILTFGRDGEWPSDHFPVLARLVLPPPDPLGR